MIDDTGEDGVRFISDLDGYQTRRFLGTACRRAPSVGGVSRVGTDRFHSVSSPTLSLGAGCGDGLSDAETRRYYNAVVEAAEDDSEISASTVLKHVESVNPGTRRGNLKRLFANAGADGIRLVREMDADTQRKFFDVGENGRFSGFHRFDDWRSSVAKADVDTSEGQTYINRIDRAAGHSNIDGADELVREVADNPNQVVGQNGEAGSALRYADDGHDVEVEPGDGGYDLAVTRDQQTEFVEVKTRDGNGVSDTWVDNQISSINKKYRNAQDSDTDISKQDSVLELRTNGDASDLESAKEIVESVVSRRQRVQAGEIRIVSKSGDVVTLET